MYTIDPIDSIDPIDPIDPIDSIDPTHLWARAGPWFEFTKNEVS